MFLNNIILEFVYFQLVVIKREILGEIKNLNQKIFVFLNIFLGFLLLVKKIVVFGKEIGIWYIKLVSDSKNILMQEMIILFVNEFFINFKGICYVLYSKIAV